MDLASGTLVRVRVTWPEDHGPDLAPFDVVEAQLAEEPERDDLAQPEAVTADRPPPPPRDPPRPAGPPAPPPAGGPGRGARARASPARPPPTGSSGGSAPRWPWWSRPRARSCSGGSTTARSGSASGGDAATTGSRSRTAGPSGPSTSPGGTACTGKDLAAALGFKPHYLLASVSTPRDGHCYKTVRALLPRELTIPPARRPTGRRLCLTARPAPAPPRSRQPTVTPSPLLPDYRGACIANLVPALLGGNDPTGAERRLAAGRRPAAPPGGPAGPRRSGLGAAAGPADSGPHPDRRPTASTGPSPRWPRPPRPAPSPRSPPGAARATTACSATGWPSTTRSSTCCAGPSGAAGPATPGATVPARRFQPCPPFAGLAAAGAGGVQGRVRGDRVHRRPSRQLPAARLHACSRRSRSRSAGCCAPGEPFVYAYYDGIDKVAHGSGLGELYDAELRGGRPAGGRPGVTSCPPGAVLVVTADHGQIDVGPQRRAARARRHVRRCSSCPARAASAGCTPDPGPPPTSRPSPAERYGDSTWVMSRDQLIDEGLFGGPVAGDELIDRLGDVALLPHAPDRLRRPGRHRGEPAAEPSRLPDRRRDAGPLGGPRRDGNI